LEASQVSEIIGISRQTINKLFAQVRERISEYCNENRPFETDEIE
jgi:predicted DNA-binding protein (UPF0251 family)